MVDGIQQSRCRFLGFVSTVNAVGDFGGYEAISVTGRLNTADLVMCTGRGEPKMSDLILKSFRYPTQKGDSVPYRALSEPLVFLSDAEAALAAGHADCFKHGGDICESCGGATVLDDPATIAAAGKGLTLAFCIKCWNERGEQLGAAQKRIQELEGTKDHPEHYCHRCGGRNIGWYADSDLWNKFDPVEGILCPICFVLQAEAGGVETAAWRVAPEDESDEKYRLMTRLHKSLERISLAEKLADAVDAYEETGSAAHWEYGIQDALKAFRESK